MEEDENLETKKAAVLREGYRGRWSSPHRAEEGRIACTEERKYTRAYVGYRGVRRGGRSGAGLEATATYGTACRGAAVRAGGRLRARARARKSEREGNTTARPPPPPPTTCQSSRARPSLFFSLALLSSPSSPPTTLSAHSPRRRGFSHLPPLPFSRVFFFCLRVHRVNKNGERERFSERNGGEEVGEGGFWSMAREKGRNRSGGGSGSGGRGETLWPREGSVECGRWRRQLFTRDAISGVPNFFLIFSSSCFIFFTHEHFTFDSRGHSRFRSAFDLAPRTALCNTWSCHLRFRRECCKNIFRLFLARAR